MQVQVNPAAQGYCPPVAAARQGAGGGGFGALLSTAASGEAVLPLEQSAEIPSPKEVYEQMTMRSAQSAGKTVAGVPWTDQLLANFAGGFGGAHIDTTKTINWDSTGDQSLTSAQAEMLQKKYDVNNLSPQDYYDLMSDLTHLNVLGAQDIHAMHFRQLPPGNFQVGVLTASSVAPWGERFDLNNLLATVMQERAEAQGEWDWMKTDEYWDANPSISRDAYDKYLGYLENRTGRMERLQEVLEAIRG